ncbi:MAG: DegT/DnrJ/EryC1/StrS aminotransferase family protein, partial [Acidobacteria bacterium]|nr:DegT/DnrJ/EryC1/StrS aminotransferase family protein [Acidobacteriota bacterium]
GRDIAILEDCCESQGATVGGLKVGNMADGGTFSFYWGHHMTTVEGGMICTDDEELYKACVLKRSHGLARELPAEYHAPLKASHPDIDFNFLFLTDGFNFRNTEFSAVLGLRQIGRIDEYIGIRNANYARFVALCERYPDDLRVLHSEGGSSFVLPFLFNDVARKQAFQRFIQETGIESRPLISGNLLRQPFLSKYYRPEEYPNADFLHTNAFYIGNNQFVDAARLDVLEELMARSLGRRDGTA